MSIKQFLKKIFGIADLNVLINMQEISGEKVQIYSVSKNGDIIINILGDVSDIQSDIKIQVSGNVSGNIVSSSAINCGNIKGNVTAVSINSGDIKGTVISHENINFNKLSGKVIVMKQENLYNNVKDKGEYKIKNEKDVEK